MRVKHIAGWEAEVVRNTSDTTFVEADDPRLSGEYASSVFEDIEEKEVVNRQKKKETDATR